MLSYFSGNSPKTMENQVQMVLRSNPGLTITPLNNVYQPRNQVQTCKYCTTTFTDPTGMIQLLHYVTVHLNNYPERIEEAYVTKGQLISNCPFGVKTSSKKQTKFFPGFLP